MDKKKDLKTKRYFAQIFNATFCNQNHSEYFGSNRSVSIKVISVDHVFNQKNRSSSYEKHSIFYLYVSDDGSRDSATILAHIK